MLNGIIDTHAHYDDAAFDADRDAVMKTLGVGMDGGDTATPDPTPVIINVSASVDSLERVVELTETYAGIYGAVGIHPDEVGDITPAVWERMRTYCDRDKIVAVGEIGLDYYWDKMPRQTQIDWFVRQIDLAREKHLPILVHSRDAAQDTYDTIRQQRAEELGGIIHCYSGSVEMAKQYVDMGFYLGIGGVVTFKNAKVIKEVVKAIPLTSLVLETDCPYLAPVPHRGERNDSGYLPFVVQKIAALKGITEEEVIAVTARNARTLIGR